jgi:hypothetical protein
MSGDPHIYGIQNVKYSNAITLIIINKNAEIVCDHTMVLVIGTSFTLC